MTLEADRRAIRPEALEALRKTILEIFANGMYQDVGIRQICKQARVSPQTVYKYFGNKNEMLYACIRSDLETLYVEALKQADTKVNTIDKCMSFLNTWCCFYFKNPGIARIVFLNIPQAYWLGHNQLMHTSLHRGIIRTILEGQNQSAVWDETSAELLAHAMMGIAHRLMIRWLISEENSERTKQALTTTLRKLLEPTTPR